MKRKTLSIVLATFNEEENLSECLESVINLADEIIIVDGTSTDRTVAIAKKYGAKVFIKDNPVMFHINKEKALELATKDWILQLDADERVSKSLALEIKKFLTMSEEEIISYQQNLPHKMLFHRHQSILEKRDGKIGTEGTYAGFFVPRLNYFLGKYLRYGGVYPDGVIRLVVNKKAYFPCRDVHEQIVVKGKVGWLENPLYHKDSPTFQRYLIRNKRYIHLLAQDLQREKIGKDPFTIISYLFFKPTVWFLSTQIRHKGILDGYQGIIFSFFSALRFPRAYLEYLTA